jgi:putative Mg2+ transporter-C (MgtC) family protein
MDQVQLSMVSRVLVAALLGAIIGVQRESRGKAAGLRTNALITLGSAMFGVLSVTVVPHAQGDPSRIAAAVVSGIGFLGGGAILRHEQHVLGLTSAATIWVDAAIGLAVGVGMYTVAIAVTVVTLFVLEVLPYVENLLGRHLVNPRTGNGSSSDTQ